MVKFTSNLVRKVANSRFLMISALLHVVLVLLFGGTVLFNKFVEPPDFQAEGDFLNAGDVSTAPPPEPSQPMPTPSLNVATPTVTAPSAALSALTTMNPTATSFNVPVAPSIAPAISNTLTEKMAAAPSASAKSGPMGQLPGTMRARGSEHRSTTMAQNGGKMASEQAVVNALRFLQKVQNPDGTWGKTFRGAMTGLALLCYLGHGETPTTSREFGVVVSNAIDALVKQGTLAKGILTFNPAGYSYRPAGAYEHGIASYALGEAYTMTKDEKIAPVLTQAIGYIVKGQRSDGGWTYQYDTSPNVDEHGYVKSDTSVSGWQIQALKAAHLTGLPIENVDAALDSSIRNLERVFNPKDGSFGYRKAGDHPNHTLTGVGVLCKLFWQGKSDKMTRDGVKAIEGVEVKYTGANANLYAWYYDTQACFMTQGGAWDHWNRAFQDEIVAHQSPDGSWPPTGGKEVGISLDPAEIHGQIYRTAMCALMLEVYYRYLPTGREGSSGPATPSNL